jgi:hypothetical protein
MENIMPDNTYRCPSCGAASFTVACGRPCPHCTDSPSVLEIHGAVVRGSLSDAELEESASRLVESHGATSMEEARAIIRGGA